MRRLKLTVLAFASLMTMASASGQETWLPAFSPGRHFYVDPQLPDAVGSAAKEIEELSAPHQLKVYVVYTMQGTEENETKQKFAPWKLEALTKDWSAAAGFPRDDYLLLLIVRARADATKNSAAAAVGSRLEGYMLDPEYLASPRGPVLRDFQTYLPDDPGAYAASVVRNVNKDIDYALAARSRTR
jgi:hypothetical protein